MRMSQLFSQTIRDNPTSVDKESYQLLIRAGFIRQGGQRSYSFLPLGCKSIRKIEQIIREEINKYNGQEIILPLSRNDLDPEQHLKWVDLGNKLGILNTLGPEFNTTSESDILISRLAQKEIRSYRQLPQTLYHFIAAQNSYQNLTNRSTVDSESLGMISYSLGADRTGLNRQYEDHRIAYEHIFRKSGLFNRTVLANAGIDGVIDAEHFISITEDGDDIVFVCDHCGYAAMKAVARIKKVPLSGDLPLPIEKIATPNTKTIIDLANFLSIPPEKTAKAVFLMARFIKKSEIIEKFVFAVVRGDMEVNEFKLKYAIHASDLMPATDPQIREAGVTPGYASPIGLKDAIIVVDDLIPGSTNLVAGANIEGYHLRNVNYGRDYTADIVADITTAREGDGCNNCGHQLRAVNGTQIASLRKVGPTISEALGWSYLDSEGNARSVYLGSYSLNIERLMASIAGSHHDEHGLKWPISISPYSVHLISLAWKNKDNEASSMADTVYQSLSDAKIDCLYDDREESPGVKFNDADLIGIPIRLTISDKSIKNGGIEYKRRDQQERSIISTENIFPLIIEELKLLAE